MRACVHAFFTVRPAVAWRHAQSRRSAAHEIDRSRGARVELGRRLSSHCFYGCRVGSTAPTPKRKIDVESLHVSSVLCMLRVPIQYKVVPVLILTKLEYLPCLYTHVELGALAKGKPAAKPK